MLTKNLENLKPVVDEVFNTLVIGENSLLARIPVLAPVRNIEAGWIDDVIAKLEVPVSGVTSSTISLGGDYADQIVVGAELRNAKNADIYKVESKANNVLTISKVNTENDPVSGTFVVDNIPLGVEASTSGRKIEHQGVKKTQYTRIFRADAELSNSVLETDTYDKASYLQTQINAALVEIKNSLASAIWFGKKSKTDADNTRSFDGLYEAAKNAGVTPVSGAGGSITYALLTKLAQAMKGGHATHLFVNPAAAGDLSDIIFQKQHLVVADQTLGAYAAIMKNPITGENIEIVTDTNVPTGDIWLVDITGLELHPLGGRDLSVTDATAPNVDSTSVKVIKEVTFFTKNAGQKLAYISGLKY